MIASVGIQVGYAYLITDEIREVEGEAFWVVKGCCGG